MLASKIKKLLNSFDNRGLDSLFIACVTSLILIGLVMVASSTIDFAAAKFSNPLFFLKKHLIFIFLGVLVLYIVARIKMKFYFDYGQYFLIASIILSLLVHIPGLGLTINGATRWINLGFFTLQISEVSRLFFFIWLSGYITRNNFDKNEIIELRKVFKYIFFSKNKTLNDRILEIKKKKLNLYTVDSILNFLQSKSKRSFVMP